MLVTGAFASPGRASVAATAAASSELFTYADPQIDESSGIAASSFDETFYTHNDSGDSARFFRVDAHGNTVAVYTLRGAHNVDWEDMATGTDAAGKPVLYFGDIGDNDHVRKEIAVYVVPEPHGPSSDVTWTRYRFSYPDGAHDAEALLVNPHSRRIYIATKEFLNDGTLFAAPATLTTTGLNVLTAVGSVPPLTTSGDFAPDGTRVVLLTYATAFWADDVGGAWHRFKVPLPHQAEAIAYTRDGSSVLIGGEAAHSIVYRAAAPTRQPTVPTAPSNVPPSQSAVPEPASPSAAASSPQAQARKSGARTPTVAIVFIAVGVPVLVAIFAVRRRRRR